MSSWVDAWIWAETICFEYLRTILEGGEEDSFQGEVPKDFQYSEEAGMWMFSLMGGGEPLDFEFNMNSPGACGDERRLNCMFQGIWTERERAMQVAGTIMDSLPIAEGTLTGIRRFKPTEEPTIERTTIPMRSDQARGGELRVWQVTYPLHCLFTKGVVDG